MKKWDDIKHRGMTPERVEAADANAPHRIRAQRLHQIARRLRDTPCCGRGDPLVTDDDWRFLDLWPMPMVFDSSLGRIAPNSGWYARCLYAYERLTGWPFPGRPEDKRLLPDLVADEVDRLAVVAESG